MTDEPYDPFTAIPDFPELETERLVLREVTIEDAGWFLHHFSQPEISHGQGWPPPAGIDAAREQLTRFFVELFAQRKGLRWGLTLKGSRDLIGSAGLYDWDAERRSAEMGYDLDPDFWGRGLMNEAVTAICAFAFERMDLNRIQIMLIPRNLRSTRLVERLGFVKEGVLRQHAPDETGAMVDDAVYSLLRHEWRRDDRV